MRAQGYEDLLSAEASKGPYWFYWPVARGDWWYPNIAQADVVRQRAGEPITSPARKEFDRGDLVDIGISKLRHVEGYSIGIYGGDDHSLSTIDAE